MGGDHPLNILLHSRVNHFSHSNSLNINRSIVRMKQYKQNSIRFFLQKVLIHSSFVVSISKYMHVSNVCSEKRAVSTIWRYRNFSHRARYLIVKRRISSSHRVDMYHHLLSMTSFLRIRKKLGFMSSLLQKSKI